MSYKTLPDSPGNPPPGQGVHRPPNFQALSLGHTQALWRPPADSWHQPSHLPVHVLALRPSANIVPGGEAPGRMAALPAHLRRISTQQPPSSAGSQQQGSQPLSTGVQEWQSCSRSPSSWQLSLLQGRCRGPTGFLNGVGWG